LLHHLDQQLFQLINAFAGRYWVLDRLVENEEALHLFKGGLLLGLYWLFWFRRGDDRQDRRATILAAIGGAFAGLVVARALAAALPFRVRPIYDLTSGVQLPSYPIHLDMEDWSAFPSDTATYFVALAAGFWFLRRLLGVALVIWALVYICLPRVFLGIHYPSDIAAGAALGILSAAVFQHSAFKSWIARPVLAFEDARPDLFYPLMFLLSYELAVVFTDIRNPLRAATHALRHYGVLSVSENVFLFVVLAGLMAVPCLVALVFYYRRIGPQLTPSTEIAPFTGQEFRPNGAPVRRHRKARLRAPGDALGHHDSGRSETRASSATSTD
jgi:undecaprenyl-diphosphatase